MAIRSANPPDLDDAYRRYATAIYWTAYGRLQDHAAAEDVTHDAFEKAIHGLPRYRDQNLPAWLCRIAFTTTMDELKRRGRSLPMDDELDLADGDATPEEAVLREELRELVRRALPVLTPAENMVIQLRLQELSGNEIAEALGKTRNWVDVTASRAIKRLRSHLLEQGGGAS